MYSEDLHISAKPPRSLHEASWRERYEPTYYLLNLLETRRAPKKSQCAEIMHDYPNRDLPRSR
eukprot:3909738-Pleurochrysis_carterae.AAC.1